jgi:putative ABC transport system ATP-binding protein
MHTAANDTVTDNPSAASPSLIQAKHVTKVFKRDAFEIAALNDVSVTVKKGAFVAIMGPSGSGKSTLLNLIAGIDKPTKGELLVDGSNIHLMTDTEASTWRNRNIGYVFQSFYLIPVLTAFENVELPLLLSTLSPKKRQEHVHNALELVGLKDRADHLPRQLSGGQEQRVAIARAIVSDPQIILADEPTGDLDRASTVEVMELLKQLNQHLKKTIILVTHDQEAAGYADEVNHLEKGVLSRP